MGVFAMECASSFHGRSLEVLFASALSTATPSSSPDSSGPDIQDVLQAQLMSYAASDTRANAAISMPRRTGFSGETPL